MSNGKRLALSLVTAFVAGFVIGAVLYALDIAADTTLGNVLIALAAVGVGSITWAQTKSPQSN
jgi:high-affinity Fe2+/Pb2+ permease